MLLLSKQVKNSIYLVVACCSGIYVTKAMEQQTPGIEKNIEVEASPWARLPAGVREYIISFLESAKDQKEAVKNIKGLSQTSKELNKLINDTQVLGDLIQAISRRFNISPIDVASEFNNPGALNWLKNYAQQNPQEKKLLDKRLRQAAKEGNMTLTQFLLNAGADVNTQGKWGYTPLQLAVIKGQNDMVDLLLNAGAHVNQSNKLGNAPLHWAVTNGNTDAIQLLLKYGADINQANKNGTTPLSAAIGQGKEDIVELLQQFEIKKTQA
jgi:hypothetical protein